MSKFSAYISLTKPGIVRGNLFAALAGFLLAADGKVDFFLLLSLIVGVGLVIASACVINNGQDIDIDRKMKRTKNRELVVGRVTKSEAQMYAAGLGLFGFLLLILSTNMLTVFIGLVGYIDYLVFYYKAKRRSSWGTLVGSISGATPLVAGYTAVKGNFDSATLVLFLIMVCWQMAHFLSIALYRYNDYKEAGVPVLPVASSIENTKKQILYYTLAFVFVAELLVWFGYTGLIYMLVVSLVGLYWAYLYLQTSSNNSQTWGKRMFLFSLIALSTVFVMLSANSFLP